MFQPRIFSRRIAHGVLVASLLAAVGAASAQPTPNASKPRGAPLPGEGPTVVTAEGRTQAAKLISEATALIDSFSGSLDPLKDAMTRLNEAEWLDPQNPRLYIEYARLGIVWTGLGPATLKRAEFALRKSIEVDANVGDAHVLLGYVLAHLGRREESDAEFAKGRALPHTPSWLEGMTGELAARRQAEDEVTRRAKEHEKYLAEAPARARAAGETPRARGERLVHEAAKLLDEAGSVPRDTLTPAREKLEEALALDSRIPRAHVEIGRLVMKSAGLGPGPLQAAERSIRTAIEIDPRFGDAYVLLGYVLTHLGRLDEAQQAFAKAQSTPHTSPWLESNMAELARARGNEQQAIEILARIAYDKGKPANLRIAALSDISEYYAATGAIDRVERAYVQHLALAPTAFAPNFNLGGFLRAYRLDLPRSEAYLRQAMKINDNPRVRSSLAKTLYYKWADAWIRDRNSAAAAAIFDEASALDPSLRDIVSEIGILPRAHPLLDAMVAQGIGLDISMDGPSGTTPMCLAAKSGSIEVVRQLLRLGAHPNTPGYKGVTALMAAASEGNAAIVKLLLDSGADPNLRTSDGWDAEAYARKRGAASVTAQLAQAKQTFVPTASTMPSTPFKVGYIYRVKKSWRFDQWTSEGRFDAGEEVVFDYPHEFGNRDIARFFFRPPSGEGLRQFMVDKKNVASWREYFEEIGPAPTRAPIEDVPREIVSRPFPAS